MPVRLYKCLKACKKSEPHHRVIRFGFMLPTPEVWVPTLSAGEEDKDKSEPHHRVIRFGFLVADTRELDADPVGW